MIFPTYRLMIFPSTMLDPHKKIPPSAEQLPAEALVPTPRGLRSGGGAAGDAAGGEAPRAAGNGGHDCGHRGRDVGGSIRSWNGSFSTGNLGRYGNMYYLMMMMIYMCHLMYDVWVMMINYFPFFSYLIFLYFCIRWILLQTVCVFAQDDGGFIYIYKH